MEHQPVAPAAQMTLHGLTIMDTGIVTNDMDFAVAQQTAAQIVEMTDEQSCGAALFGEPRGHEQGSRPPVERTRQVAFFIGAGGRNHSLAAPAHPHGPDFGIGITCNGSYT